MRIKIRDPEYYRLSKDHYEVFHNMINLGCDLDVYVKTRNKNDIYYHFSVLNKQNLFLFAIKHGIQFEVVDANATHFF